MKKKDKFEKAYKRSLKEYDKGELCWADFPIFTSFGYSQAPDVKVPMRVYKKVISKEKTFNIDPEVNLPRDRFTIRIYRRHPLEIAVPIKKDGHFDVYDPLLDELKNPPKGYELSGYNKQGDNKFQRSGYSRQMVKDLTFHQYYNQPIMTFYQLDNCCMEDWDKLIKAWENSKNHTGDWQPFNASMKDVRGRCSLEEADEFERKLGEKLPVIELYNADDFIFYAYPGKFFKHSYGIKEYYSSLTDAHGKIITFFSHPLTWLRSTHDAYFFLPHYSSGTDSSIYCEEKMLHNMAYRKEAYIMGLKNYHLDKVYQKNKILIGPVMDLLRRYCGFDPFILRMKARWLGWVPMAVVVYALLGYWLYNTYG